MARKVGARDRIPSGSLGSVMAAAVERLTGRAALFCGRCYGWVTVAHVCHARPAQFTPARATLVGGLTRQE